MSIYDKNTIIELNNDTVGSISHSSIYCYVIIGGNPYGMEGFVYIFTEEHLQRRVYKGNIYAGLSGNELCKCIPELGDVFSIIGLRDKHPQGWVMVPYYMGHYVFMPEGMAERVKNIWNELSAKCKDAEEKMVMGIVEAYSAYKCGGNDNNSTHLMKLEQNVLRDAFELYPALWKEPIRFRAVLMDLLPQDKLRRNLLCMCVEENIPDELLAKKEIGKMEVTMCKKRLINACGCSELLSEEIIRMWLDAFRIVDEGEESIKYSYEATEISPSEIKLEFLCGEGLVDIRTFNCLRRAGIHTIGDLTSHSDEEIRNVRNLGRRSYERVLRLLDEYGLKLKEDDKATKIMGESLSEVLSLRAYKTLERKDIYTVGDFINMPEQKFICLYKHGKDFPVEILHNLLNAGIPEALVSPFYTALKEHPYEEFDFETEGGGVPENLGNISVDDLELGVRSYNCLKRAGAYAVADIVDMSGQEFVNIRNLGVKSAEEILIRLEYIGVPEQSIKHLRKALDERRLSMKNEVKAEEEKKTAVQEVEEQVDEIEQKVKDMQIALALSLAGKSMQEKDYETFLMHMEAAVEYGYKGNYALIGMHYLAGLNGIQKDFDKGYEWITRFYEEYKENKLEVEDKGTIIQVCYNLAICTLWIEMEKTENNEISQDVIEKVISYFKDAIEHCPEEVSAEWIEENEIVRMMISNIGNCLFYGTIRSEGHEEVIIGEDYELAHKALAEACSMGDVKSMVLLAEMYEKGLGVEQNIDRASRRYLSAATKGDEDAIEWCQKYFVDDLQWESNSNWDNIQVSDVVSIRFKRVMDKLGLSSFEDVRMIKFADALDSSIPGHVLARFFQTIRQYVNGYKK